MKYRAKLNDNGYIQYSGFTNQAKIRNDFLNYYSQNILNILDSNIALNEISWINHITSRRPKDFIHPIRHILFIRFLFGNVNNFINYKIYNDGNIKEIYQGLSPDFLEKKIAKQHDKEWDSKLFDLVNGGTTKIGTICDIMKCCRKKVIFHCVDLGIIDKINTHSKLKDYKLNRQVNKVDTKKCKQNILDYLNKTQNVNRTMLKKKLKDEYRVISKLDKKWLDSVLPMFAYVNKNSQARVDWRKRDAELERLVNKTVVTIYTEENPVQITKKEIFIRMGVTSVINRLSCTKLPKTMKAINISVETHENFMARKIVHSLKGLLNQNFDITDEKNLRQYFKNYIFNKYKAIINVAVNELS